MKKVINGKVYNTETAELIHRWDNGFGYNDLKSREKNLYRTKKGSWFIHHWGGAMTDMAVRCGSNNYGGSASIEPVTEQDAIKFLESKDGDEVLIKLFPDRIVEA